MGHKTGVTTLTKQYWKLNWHKIDFTPFELSNDSNSPFWGLAGSFSNACFVIHVLIWNINSILLSLTLTSRKIYYLWTASWKSGLFHNPCFVSPCNVFHSPSWQLRDGTKQRVRSRLSGKGSPAQLNFMKRRDSNKIVRKLTKYKVLIRTVLKLIFTSLTQKLIILWQFFYKKNLGAYV